MIFAIPKEATNNNEDYQNDNTYLIVERENNKEQIIYLEQKYPKSVLTYKVFMPNGEQFFEYKAIFVERIEFFSVLSTVQGIFTTIGKFIDYWNENFFKKELGNTFEKEFGNDLQRTMSLFYEYKDGILLSE